VGFYSRYAREVALLHSKVTDALRHGYGEPQRAGATGGSTVSLRARAHRVARGLTGRDATWRFVRCWCMPCSCAESKVGPWYSGAQRRRGGDTWRHAHATSRKARSRPGPSEVPLFACTKLKKLHVNFTTVDMKVVDESTL
jgi:hypothetical protein